MKFFVDSTEDFSLNEGIKKLQQFFLFLVRFNARCIIIYKSFLPAADSNLLEMEEEEFMGKCKV